MLSVDEMNKRFGKEVPVDGGKVIDFAHDRRARGDLEMEYFRIGSSELVKQEDFEL